MDARAWSAEKASLQKGILLLHLSSEILLQKAISQIPQITPQSISQRAQTNPKEQEKKLFSRLSKTLEKLRLNRLWTTDSQARIELLDMGTRRARWE